MTMAAVSTDLGPLFGNARDFLLGWGCTHRLDADLALYRSGISHPQLNGVVGLRHGGLDEALTEATARLADVPWLWWVGADSRPGLTEDLLTRGATTVGKAPVMAIDLDEVGGADGPAELRIAEVTGAGGADELAEWVRAYRVPFGFTVEQTDEVIKAEESRPTDSVVRFAGRVEGRIVGTSVLFAAHGVAGVYNVATVEAYRRQGVGTRLTAAALRAGRERGLRIGTLQATSMGASMYRRMGFSQVSGYRLLQLPQSTDHPPS
ncbi:MAG TPA: GNAT family N-acetyltransferase [Pseudonocardiaceae bacterium]|jgi:ribosomal protein S18 acetylase RimI-like enzyme|nr:GNAT family N-acetyltransferase [Pseudonocardiaceae bacterium]